MFELDGEGYSTNLILCKPSSKFLEFDSLATGRALSPVRASCWLPRRWKEKCDREHANRCSMFREHEVSSIRPTWLVDTWTRCLAKTKSDERYVALSYLWGERNFLKTLKNNLEENQEPGIFSDDSDVAQTIKDAMALTESIGERYLWVDALCNVQDDEAFMRLELSRMGFIFANATLTIIDTEGSSAETGLPGFSRRTSTTLRRSNMIRFGTRYQFVPSQTFSVFSKWSLRGWTMQEGIFTSRAIIYDETRVYWQCQCNTWSEEQREHSQNIDLIIGKGDQLLGKVPDVPFVCETLDQFNQRVLTFPEDVLPAFQGLLSVLSPGFKDGFISGIPSAFFYAALLWNTARPGKRRRAKSNSQTNVLPSWSWAGWEGPLELSSWYFASFEMDVEPSNLRRERIIPCVQWKSHRSLEETGSLINFSWWPFEQKYTRERSATPSHPGWIQRTLDIEQSKEPLNPKYIYQLETDTRAIPAALKFPIPLADQDAFENSLTYASFISGMTRRTWMKTGRFACNHDLRRIVWLQGKNGIDGGLLRPTSWELESGPQSQQVELIELSKGETFELFDSIGHLTCGDRACKASDRMMRKRTLRNVFHVMWIEWIDGVACRRGLGAVYQETWESQRLEHIQITLS